MFKKLTSLLLSLLLCLSLLPAQALAADLPENDPPIIIEEPVDPETPVDPEDPNDPGATMPTSAPPVPDDDESPFIH